MPVNLNTVPVGRVAPMPIRKRLWLLLLAVIIGFGSGLLLFLWPKGSPMSGLWFWLCELAFPFLAWIFFLGIRLNVYEGQLNRARDRNERRAERLLSETRRGQRRMAVLAAVYGTAMGNADLDEKLLNDGIGLQWINSPGMTDPVQCALLPEEVRGKAIDVASLTALFRRMLMPIGPKLKGLPRNVPIHVRLQVSAGVGASVVSQAWRDASTEFAASITSLQYVDAATGLLVLDRWLDANESVLARSVFVIIALQLHPIAVDHAAEVVTAMLLSRGIQHGAEEVMAILHRPVAYGETDLSMRCEDVLRWGSSDAGAITAWWTNGFDVAHLNAVSVEMDQADVGAEQENGMIHFDLAAALGDAGIAAGWLAATAAIERCRKDRQPQLVAASENGGHRLFVVAPASTWDPTEIDA